MFGKKRKKDKDMETPRAPRRMWRTEQRAHTFTDRKKKASRDACRKGNY